MYINANTVDTNAVNDPQHDQQIEAMLEHVMTLVVMSSAADMTDGVSKTLKKSLRRCIASAWFDGFCAAHGHWNSTGD